MANITITLNTDNIELALNDQAKDRKEAIISRDQVRAICKSNISEKVEMVFNSGEIKELNHAVIDSISGDNNITSQDIVYNKLKTWRFA